MDLLDEKLLKKLITVEAWK